MFKRRSGLSCVSVNGSLYALGGYNGNDRLRCCEKYDFRKRRWEFISSMLTPRSNFEAVVINNKIMVIGGYDGTKTTEAVESYDISSGKWSFCYNLQHPRSALACCIVKGTSFERKELQHFAYPNR